MSKSPDHSDVTFDSLKKELQGGLAFATRARNSRDDHHRLERNRATAQRVCRKIARLMPKATLTAAQTAELTTLLEELRATIDAVPG